MDAERERARESDTANLGWSKRLFHIMENINNKLVSKQWKLVNLC